MHTRAWPLLSSLLAGACVSAEFRDGQFSCDPNDGEDACPPGLTCDEGMCRETASAPGAAGAGGTGATGGTSPDGGGGAGGAPCVPKTCAQLSPACGNVSDACGGELSCACGGGTVCEGAGGNGAGVCACPSSPQERLPTDASNETGVGAVKWVNAANIKLLDAIYTRTEVGLAPGEKTNRLNATAYQFDIPAGATVEGVEAILVRRKDGAGTVRDETIQLLVGNNTVGKDYAHPTNTWSATDETVVYGGPTDPWETTLLADDIDSGFGLRVRANNSGTSSNATPKIDAVTMRVYFSCAP